MSECSPTYSISNRKYDLAIPGSCPRLYELVAIKLVGPNKHAHDMAMIGLEG